MLTAPLISPEQVHSFNEEGYLIYRQPVFEEGKFQRLRTVFERILKEQTQAGIRPEALDKPHYIYPELFEWILSDEIMDLVEPILGPDMLFFASHFICKPKGDGKRVPWHEDSAYWKNLISPMEAVTVWLAIDSSTKENGCMYVIPRSHETGKKGFSDYEGVDVTKSVFPTEIVKPQQRDELAVPIKLQANQCSLHDSKMIHGSPPNTSDKRRCGFTMRFVRGSVKLNPEWENQLRFYPARGRNLANNLLADPGKAYPELWDTQAKSSRKVH